MSQPEQDTVARESMEYDVVVVGAGPGGLATAIRLKQLATQAGREVSVCVLEKGSEAGAHILSGAIMDPKALTELFPDWKERGAPLKQAVTTDEFLFLDETGARQRRTGCCPSASTTRATTSSAWVRWCAGWRSRPKPLGVEIFAGFAAAEVLYDDAGAVKGVATGDMGIGKDGEPTDQFQLGMELHARYTIFAEGARGQLGRQLIAKYKLDAGKDPQSYGIGIKELWQADPARHQPGLVVHTAGWPLDGATYGGSFLYHAEDGKIAVGFVVGLDYKNPWLSPFEEFQRFKTHPAIRKHLEGGKRIGYGARAITAGGLLSCRGWCSRVARWSVARPARSTPAGSRAATPRSRPACWPPRPPSRRLATAASHDELSAYPIAFEQSWLHAELLQAKNFKQWFKKGRTFATLMTGIEQWLLPKLGIRNPPWTIHRRKPDHACLEPAATSRRSTTRSPMAC
jgi:electron-transferring-flavoprotein dehydrogenase